jgi:hypothetical protein
MEVQPTGEVLTRVREPYRRIAPRVYDVSLAFDTGEVEEISGTEEHPFWVPSMSEWVPLSELTPGTVVQTESRGQARVVVLAEQPTREGAAAGVPVFNFEVAAFQWPGLHNYFVRGVDGNGPGVLVHNRCDPTTSRAARRDSMRQNNTPTSRPTTSPSFPPRPARRCRRPPDGPDLPEPSRLLLWSLLADPSVDGRVGHPEQLGSRPGAQDGLLGGFFETGASQRPERSRRRLVASIRRRRPCQPSGDSSSRSSRSSASKAAWRSSSVGSASGSASYRRFMW